MAEATSSVTRVGRYPRNIRLRNPHQGPGIRFIGLGLVLLVAAGSLAVFWS